MSMASPPTTAAPPPVDLADLKRKSVRGGMITFASQGASVAIQVASTVVLARLLTPEDYGVMAMVAAVTAFAGLFRDLGLSSAAIQKKDLTRAQQSNLFWLNVALGCALTVLLAAASPLVARFYGRPEVRPVTLALSLSFIISSLSAQSGALLVREMRFGRQSVGIICGALVSLSVSITLALHDFRYWALVWGQLAGAAATTTLLFSLSSFRPGLPSRGTGLKAMVKFGANITAFDFVNYFHRNLDKILIGKFWSADMLGLYSRAYSLLMFPITNLRGPINAVAFPAMSRLQNEPQAYRAYYRKITSLLGLLSMPCAAFLWLDAASIIQLALGRQWMEAVPIFSVLALVAFIQPSHTLWGVVLLSSGRPHRYLKLGIVNTGFSVVGILGGLPWGAIGVSVGYALGTYISAYPILLMAFRGTAVCAQDFIFAVARAAFASAAAATTCCLVGAAFSSEWSLLSKLIFDLGLFLPLYLAIFYSLPGGANELVSVARLARPLAQTARLRTRHALNN